MLNILQGGLDDPQVIALLKFHFDTNIRVTPKGSAHVFDLSRLQQTDVMFWSVWENQKLLGTGALKLMGKDQGEVKSMHTLLSARRKGVAKFVLQHILAIAREKQLKKLYLETGSFVYFAPARALYAGHGFVECEAYEGYAPDKNSTFMKLQL
jgi:putative acetyltransferase